MILGGTVSYEDAVKKDPGDQYSNSRKVRVELNFAVPEDPGIDPDAVLAEVMEKAIALTNEKLGLTKPTRAAASTVVVPAVKTKADLEVAAVAKAGGEPTKPVGAKRGPKPKVAAEPAKAAEDWDTGNANAATAEATSTTNTAGESVAQNDEWAADPVAEITDKSLNDAVSAKNGVLKDPPKIRALIGSFNPNPKKQFNLRDIPQEQRQTFLDKLEALK